MAAKRQTPIVVEDADALYAEYAAQGVEFARGLGNMPWHCREFVVEGLRWPSAGLRREPVAPFLCYAVFMANTRSATLSIRLKSETKRRLARLAVASGRSSNFLISDAVESYVADQERMLAEMRQADRQVKSGHYVRHQDMKAWLLSWGTDRELPPPKCVCGKVHADESPRPNSRG